MTEDERAALVWRTTVDLFNAQPDRDTFEKARREVKAILAAIEPAIRADERARVVAEATTDEAVERAERAHSDTKSTLRLYPDALPQPSPILAAIRAALEAKP
jgi:hypothetical protein